jgi:hypothetical protein
MGQSEISESMADVVSEGVADQLEAALSEQRNPPAHEKPKA